MTEYCPAKTGEKYLKDNKHNNLHLGRKYARIFLLGHYLFLEANSFPRTRVSETVHFSERIMSEGIHIPVAYFREKCTVPIVSVYILRCDLDKINRLSKNLNRMFVSGKRNCTRPNSIKSTKTARSKTVPNYRDNLYA